MNDTRKRSLFVLGGSILLGIALASVCWLAFISRRYGADEMRARKMGYDNLAQYDAVKQFTDRLYSGEPSSASLAEGKSILATSHRKMKQRCLIMLATRLFPPDLQQRKYALMMSACEDPDEAVRYTLAVAVATNSGDPASQILERLAHDRSEKVRSFALECLDTRRKRN